ncbi:MAG: FHA domain-containing protein, partial [Halobacteriovoraceae bacterium]|nr:FHA domain-containing protein [Halobacteriovoraceae bacterium]
MFKLVAVGGRLRGKEIILNDGVNLFGRAVDSDHVMEVDGVSKKHMQITVNGNNCFLEDLGSSNGTFVNGKLIKKKTVTDSDRIALPNVIFQLVYVTEKKKVIKKKVLKSDEEEFIDFKESKPTDFLGKIKYQFKYNAMKVIYSFNEQYEWNVMLGILMFIFVCGNIYLSIGPVLIESEGMVYSEIIARGKQYAEEVARKNAVHLSRGDLQQIDTAFMNKLQGDGVESYELFDMDGRIVRPAKNIDNIVNDIFSVAAKNKLSKVTHLKNSYVDVGLEDGVIGVAKTLMVSNLKTGQ